MKNEEREEVLTQRHGGTEVKEKKYFFFLCALVPWCEVLLQNLESVKVRGVRMVCGLFLFSLSSLLIFPACQDPFTSSQTENFPAGKGSFSLSVAVAGTARTILPVTPDEFASYTLVFEPKSGGTKVETERSIDQLSDPVYLEPGTYNLLVTAYLEGGKPAAQGSLAGLVINEGESTSQKITLKAIIGKGSGTFIYDVTFPAGLATAGMTIAQMDNANPLHEKSFLSGGSGTTTYTETVPLDTGYYDVVFTLIKNNGDTLIWRELLHIYSNLESAWDMDFSDGDFYKTKYTVTLVLNDNPFETLEPVSVQHGAKAGEPEKPARGGHIFGGWYSDPAFSTAYNFDSLVISDITLYAKWSVSVTGVTLNHSTLSMTAGDAPVTLTATVAPANATNKNVTWSSSNTNVATVNNGTVIATGGGTTTITVKTVDGEFTASCEVTVSLPFVAVTGITGVPTTATAGTPLTLSGTVAPSNANNQTIAWSVSNAGTTGATMSGNTLNTTTAGTVTVTATIANGTAPGTPYTENFTITVKGSFTITIDFDDLAPNINGGTISRNGTGGLAETLELTVSGSFDLYQWSIDGNIIESGATASSFTVNAKTSEYNHIGSHTLYLLVYKDNVPYSKTIYFEIKE
jgi:uncharacterized repeat protein (TIGR02543 family)